MRAPNSSTGLRSGIIEQAYVGIVTADSNGYIVLVTYPLLKLKRLHRYRYLSS
jgi:hypothetical protein